MTVGELIAMLEMQDPDAPVLLSIDDATYEISHLEVMPQDDGELQVHILAEE